MINIRKKMGQLSLTEAEQKLRSLLLRTSAHSERHGFTAPVLRFTGGWVRDKLLGVPSEDIDVSISNMTGETFGGILQDVLANESPTKEPSLVTTTVHTIKSNPEKSKHLETATTRLYGLSVDFVNLRKEVYTTTRTPTMEFGSPKEDAFRRDSTINALFYNLHTQEVEDFTNRGMADLHEKIIRTPLPAKQTFLDDPLRILRCIRFAARLNFKLEDETSQMMHDHEVICALSTKVSEERLGIELEKMMKGPNPNIALHLIHKADIYTSIFHNVEGCTTSDWPLAIQTLTQLSMTDASSISNEWTSLRQILFLSRKDPETLFNSWMLCLFMPAIGTTVSGVTPKYSTHNGAIDALVKKLKQSIKADNRLMNMVSSALKHENEVVSMSNHGLQKPSRGVLGMAFRRWGKAWRTTVLFALLAERTRLQSHEADCGSVFRRYRDLIQIAKDHGLLDVSIDAVVDGKYLKRKFPTKRPGPWMHLTLERAFEYQLEHPEIRDPDLIFSNSTSEDIAENNCSR